MLNLRDITNPFTRLVNTAGADDGSYSVPYYQLDQIKEATFQSDYGCDSVFKALSKLLDDSNPSVIHKAMTMVRVLMMEGPASFNSRAGGLSGRMIQLAQQSDVRKGTLEERNRDLAQAIHQAIAGDARPLSTFAEQAPATTNQATRSSYKSDFQAQQEREQKAYKKRLEDEKRSGALLVNERLFDTFDGSLPPQKLVDSAVQSHKKKFAKEELESFVAAAMQTEKPAEVCALLEAFLRDGRQTLQNRYKVLTIVEVLVAVPEAAAYLKTHSAGITRHLTVDRADNPAKSQAAQQLAQNILQLVQNAVVQQPTAARARASTVTSSPPPVLTHPQTSQAHAVQPKPTAQQWEWTPAPAAAAGSMPTFGGGKPVPSFDDMFANLSVRSAQPPAQPIQQAPQPQAWLSQPQQYQQQPQFQPQQFQQQPQPQFQQQVFSSIRSPELPAVPNNSLVVSPSLGMLALPTAVTASSGDSQAAMLQQMAELQRNMALMMQMVSQQPPAPQPALQVPAPQPALQVPAPQPAPQPLVAEQAPEPQQLPCAVAVESELSRQASDHLAHPASASEPPAAPASDSKAENMALLLQLQQQMLATQQMLAQQQAAFQILQAKLTQGNQ